MINLMKLTQIVTRNVLNTISCQNENRAKLSKGLVYSFMKQIMVTVWISTFREK